MPGTTAACQLWALTTINLANESEGNCSSRLDFEQEKSLVKKLGEKKMSN